MTHLSVHDGFENVEVIQERPSCETPCDASECAIPCGTGADTCFTTTPALDCSTSKVTGHTTDADRVCCDGLERSIDITSGPPVGEWVALTSNQGNLEQACLAFPSASCAGSPHAGVKANVQSCDAATKTCSLWVPSAQDVESVLPNPLDIPIPPPSAILTFPMFGLVAKELQTRSIVIPAATYPVLWQPASGNWGSSFFIDFHTGLVLASTAAEAVSAGLSKGWFISNIRYNVPNLWSAGARWYQYSKTTTNQLQVFTDRGDVSIYLTDEVVPLPFCNISVNTNGEVWADLSGNTCERYTNEGGEPWCTRHAEPTQAWCDSGAFVPRSGTNGDVCQPYISDMARHSCNPATNPGGCASVSTAVFECCQCGGGETATPDGWVEPSSSIQFQ